MSAAEEQTPLLISRHDSVTDGAVRSGSASVSQTIVNLGKTCCGTGTLALPYAARQGGILLHVVGLFAIAGWNLYSIQRLLDCLFLLPSSDKHRPPPEGTSTLGRVAWYSFGHKGLVALDIMMVMLLAGIVITYEDAIMSFLRDTPFSTNCLALDAIGTSILIGLLSIVPDMGYLAKASATGLTVLALTFCVIAWYGTYSASNTSSLSWWPNDGMSGVSTWFGVTVFGFGVVPLTYNMQESMVEPQRMFGASVIGLIAVAISYQTMGIGLLVLYPDISGDLLQELPKSGWLPAVVRLAMVVVVMVTAPLLVVPCGELLEGKISVNVSEPVLRTVVRLGICVVCSIISVSVPGFVQVLSFVGCFCVALVGFVMPPLLHLVLLWEQESTPDSGKTKRAVVLDLLMLTWGVLATIITSIFTLRAMKS
jgi:amino acid permease